MGDIGIGPFPAFSAVTPEWRANNPSLIDKDQPQVILQQRLSRVCLCNGFLGFASTSFRTLQGLPSSGFRTFQGLIP
jgi:hypothetical protein